MLLEAAHATNPPSLAQGAARSLAAANGFMFAAGIENGAPTVGSGRRRDHLRDSGFHARWREDFALARELGCRFLRYGPQLHTALRGPGWYDWSFADETFAELRRLGVTPIVDLCRFGVPDWIGDFQNPEFPDLFAAYARAFARRFPWARLYTPVSGMLTTALCSARQGWWNERRTDDRSYVAAIGNIVRANTLAMRAILETRPDAVFIQWECAEPLHRDSPGARPPLAERSLVLDLNYGRRVPPSLSEFLMDNGMSRAEYRFFLRQDDLRRHCVLASDWHVPDERPIGHDSAARACFARYGVPLMHIGTGLGEEPDGGEPERRLRSQWSGTMRLRQVGVPMHGFAWPSLTDRVDWDSALREASGRADGRGLCDLDRRIRPAGRACQRLIAGRGEAPLREDASSTLSLAAA